MQHEAAEIKAKRKRPDPFYRRFPADYQRATRKLSLAARGAYSDIIDLIMIEAGPLPDDDLWMCSSLHVSKREWRRVRQELLDADKIVLRDGHITNRRSEEELEWRESAKEEKRSRAPSRRLGEASCDVSRKFHERHNQGKDNEIKDRESADSIVHIREAATSVAAEQPRCDLKELSRKLFDAGGTAPSSEANAPGLASMLVPAMWLEQGADLERDVLPVVRAVAARKRSRPIQNWTYFTEAVAEAKALRGRGLPDVGSNVVPIQARYTDRVAQGYADALAALAANPMEATA